MHTDVSTPVNLSSIAHPLVSPAEALRAAIIGNPGLLLTYGRIGQLAEQLQAAAAGDEVIFHDGTLGHHEAAFHKHVTDAQLPVVQALCAAYGFKNVIAIASEMQDAEAAAGEKPVRAPSDVLRRGDAFSFGANHPLAMPAGQRNEGPVGARTAPGNRGAGDAFGFGSEHPLAMSSSRGA